MCLPAVCASNIYQDMQPGLTMWADFMDLAACGPVAWRQEIEEGIRNSAKFVAFVDEAFLLSHNCIMVPLPHTPYMQ